MNKYNVHAAYFSPTNGTKRAVSLLAEYLDDEYKLIDLTDKSKRDKKFKFSNNELVIVACPVYAGQIPMIDGLFKNLIGDNTPCIVMAAYGNRHYDDAVAQMKCILEKNHFKCIGAIASIIPHIYSNKLGVGRPDVDDIRIIKSFANEIKKKLENENFDNVEVPGNPSPSILQNIPGCNIPKFMDKSLCNSCELCSKECPVGAINSETNEIDNTLCINCMKCSFVCKTEARKFDDTMISEYLEGNYTKRREIQVFI
ncbi:MAG: 4Fe-4S binding protein [Clostridium sp.]